MCLSQTVSFTASAFLVTGGAYAVSRRSGRAYGGSGKRLLLPHVINFGPRRLQFECREIPTGAYREELMMTMAFIPAALAWSVPILRDAARPRRGAVPVAVRERPISDRRCP